MNKLPLDIQKEFFKFYNGETSVKDFEKWVYANSEIENLLSESDYLNLISLDFKKNFTKHEVHKILDQYFNLEEYEKWKIYKILNDLILKNQNFVNSLKQTYNLSSNGFGFMDHLGMGYGLNFVVYELQDWNKLSITQKQNRIDEIYNEVKVIAIKIFSWLEEGKIVITDRRTDSGHYYYHDNRSEQEKKSLFSE